MNKRDVAIFGFCLTCAIVSGLLFLLGFQPKYWADTFALIAALVGGTLITAKSIRSLLGKNFGVDILASVAIWISVFVGEYLAAALVVIMLNGGELLEAYVAARSSKVIEKLVKSIPMTARVRRDGQEVEVALDDVNVNEIVLVNPGEKIPIDGVVMKGSGLVNQAAITGESIP